MPNCESPQGHVLPCKLATLGNVRFGMVRSKAKSNHKHVRCTYVLTPVNSVGTNDRSKLTQTNGR